MSPSYRPLAEGVNGKGVNEYTLIYTFLYVHFLLSLLSPPAFYGSFSVHCPPMEYYIHH